MLDVPAGTLGCASGLFRHKLDLLREWGEVSEGVCLQIVHIEMKGVGHTSPVIDPDFEAVPFNVELGDEPVGGETAHPHRVNLGILGHESNVSGTWVLSYLVDYQLLGWLLPEHQQLVLGLSRHTFDCVLHIVFLEFRHVVRSYHGRTYNAVYECDTVIVRVVDIIGTFIFHRIQAVCGVGDIAE